MKRYVPIEQLAVIVLSNVEGPGAHTLLKDILKIAALNRLNRLA